MPTQNLLPQRRIVILVTTVLLVAVAAITGSYRRFSQTFDEPAHIASGLEWLSRGTYTYESLHPPVARVASAVGPFLDGERTSSERDMWKEGNRILNGGTSYLDRLAMARLGMLPFFIILALGAFAWCGSLAGPTGALSSLLLVCTTPTILAHAGLATTDVAVAAFLTWTCYALDKLLRNPTAPTGILFGAALGLALGSKISSLLFVAVAFVVTVGLWLVESKWAIRDLRLPKILGMFALGGGVAFFVLWACFLFDTGPLLSEGDPKLAWARERTSAIGSGTVEILLRAAVWEHWPMPEFVRGVGSVLYEVDRGRLSYLLGDVSASGHRLFFPVAISAKLPLVHLALILIGIVLAVLSWRKAATARMLGPLAFALLALVLMAPSKMTIGLRHAMPVLVALCVHAGVTCRALSEGSWLTERRRVAMGLAALIAMLQLTDIAREYPDFLSYFNPIARRSPQPVVVDSDLDWGQDLPRLAVALQEREVSSFTLAYWGTADLSRATLPPHKNLQPGERATGWIVISETLLAMNDGYSWLRAYGPHTAIGRSMRLYFVPPSTSSLSVVATRKAAESTTTSREWLH